MSLIAFFDRGARFGADRIAYTMDGDDWTFGQSRDVTCKVAHALIAMDLPLETKCAVLANNDPKAWLCVLAFWRAGLAWVPLNPRSPVEDHIQLVSGFDVEVLFFHAAFAGDIEAIRQACPQVRQFICIDGEVPGTTAFDDFCGAYPATDPGRYFPEDTLAAIMPTGGTTGAPKGVMETHRNLGMSVANGVINNPYPEDAPIVNLAAAPMTHTAGFLSLPATARGGRIVVISKA